MSPRLGYAIAALLWVYLLGGRAASHFAGVPDAYSRWLEAAPLLACALNLAGVGLRRWPRLGWSLQWAGVALLSWRALWMFFSWDGLLLFPAWVLAALTLLPPQLRARATPEECE